MGARYRSKRSCFRQRTPLCFAVPFGQHACVQWVGLRHSAQKKSRRLDSQLRKLFAFALSSIVFVASRFTVNLEELWWPAGAAALRRRRASLFVALLRDRLLTGKLHQLYFAGFERGKRPFKLCDLLVDGAKLRLAFLPR